MKKNKTKTVLIAPLNWGLGHATRDIPLIKQFLNNNYKVIIAADKAPLILLQKEFPYLQFVKIPFPEIKYHIKGNMALKMLVQVPKLLFGIIKEHFLLKKIIKKYSVDIVLSDNRYGLWNKKTYNIFITHQLEIQTPHNLRFFKKIINSVNYWFIRKFDECQVPDKKHQPYIAGKLSHPEKMPKNIKYIGILSRFKGLNIKKTPPDYEILIILSGPEPQRSIFQQIIEKQIFKSGKKALIVLGKPEEKNNYTRENIDYVGHLSSPKLAQYIVNTPHVISRSGYSSIMDYIALKKSAILIPTPGQTEQEYLAKYLHRKKWFYSIKQSRFNLQKALAESQKFSVNKKLTDY